MKLYEPSEEQQAEWRAWLATRPTKVREVAKRINPWTLYRMKGTGHRCTLVSFGEQPDGRVTLTVDITGQFNLVVFDKQVFGVDPDELEPCDAPDEDELTGTLLTEKDDIEAYLDHVRPLVVGRLH